MLLFDLDNTLLEFDRGKVLMIGDSYNTDILGGITC